MFKYARQNLRKLKFYANYFEMLRHTINLFFNHNTFSQNSGNIQLNLDILRILQKRKVCNIDFRCFSFAFDIFTNSNDIMTFCYLHIVKLPRLLREICSISSLVQRVR